MLQADIVHQAVGYIRVSSRAQTGGHSPALQEQGIKALCAAADLPLLHIENDVETGTKITRRGYQRILQLLRARVVDTVVIYMYDRFGRDAGEWISRFQEFGGPTRRRYCSRPT